MMWAVATDIIFKEIFGRGNPDPTYIVHHLYGFHFLHTDRNWDSFPSGTAAVSIAVLLVLWMVAPKWRLTGLLICVFLSGAVLIGNYHWVSDVIAGALLGLLIGWSTVRLLNPSNSRPSI